MRIYETVKVRINETLHPIHDRPSDLLTEFLGYNYNFESVGHEQPLTTCSSGMKLNTTWKWLQPQWLLRPHPVSPNARVILRWRWFILVLGLGLAAVYELVEGHRLWDAELIAETFLLGLIVPGLTWVWLTSLAYEIDRQTRQRERLERRRRLVQNLAECGTWDELIRFIVECPNTLFPVEQATLYRFPPDGDALEALIHWSALSHAAAGNAVCSPNDQACRACRSGRSHRLCQCEFQSCSPEQRLWDDLCLPLVTDNRLIGLLRFSCSEAEAVPPESLALLEVVAPEIALALSRSLAIHGQLAQARTAAQAYERRQIAQVLHNSLAQQIGYLHLSLDHLAGDGSLSLAVETLDELHHMREVAGEAYKRIRDTLAFLRSQEQADLLPAIVDHAEAITLETGLHVAVTAHGQARPLSPEMGSKLFGLVQEAIHNILKHANAKRAEITLHWLVNGLNLIITDNGVGFDASSSAPNGHFGLTMMRESVEGLGGSLAVDSQPGHGTRLQFTVPLMTRPPGSPLIGNLMTSPLNSL